MRPARYIVPLLLAVLCGCAVKPASGPRPHWTAPTAGSFLTAAGQPLSEAEVARQATDKDFILVGEGHTNPCDHAAQARIIESLTRTGQMVAIGLEMLPVTAQPVLDRFNARRITAADLGREVGWEKTWGYPYDLYRPIFELAETLDLPVVALNIPRAVLTAYRDGGEGALTPEERALAPSRVIEPSPEQKKALREQVGLHQTMREAGHAKNATTAPRPAMPGMTDRFFLVQALWDSMMAEQARTWRATLKRPLVILAGAGHVEHGWGIEYRLRVLEPTARVLAVMPVRDEKDFMVQADPAQRAQPGETLFFACAAQHKSRLGMNIVFEAETMRVDSVEPGSAAEGAGLKTGDILVAAGDTNLTEATDLHFAAMAASRQKKPLTLTIRRGSQTLTVTLPLR